MEEKFWLPEEQKVELDYLLNERGRNQLYDCGLFCIIGNYIEIFYNTKSSAKMGDFK